MSVEQLESKLLSLPLSERREFARWFYQHENDLLGEIQENQIDPQVEAEVVRRLHELQNNPSLATPVTDESFDRLKRKLRDARSAEASAR